MSPELVSFQNPWGSNPSRGRSRTQLLRSGRRAEKSESLSEAAGVLVAHLHDLAVDYLGLDQVDVARAPAFGLVHQFIRPLDQRRCQPVRDEAPLAQPSQPEADDADVDADRPHGEAGGPRRPLPRLP